MVFNVKSKTLFSPAMRVAADKSRQDKARVNTLVIFPPLSFYLDLSSLAKLKLPRSPPLAPRDTPPIRHGANKRTLSLPYACYRLRQHNFLINRSMSSSP